VLYKYHRDDLCGEIATFLCDIGLCDEQEIRDRCTMNHCPVKHASVHPGGPAVPEAWVYKLQKAKLRMLQTSNFRDSATLTHLLSVSTHLRYVDLRCCAAQKVTAALQRMHLLRTLRLMECDELTDLPPLVSLTALNSLDLWWCSSLAALPAEIGQLTGLSSLGLKGCSSLAALPAEIGQLAGLSSLDLSRCSSLAALPAEIGQLAGLSFLDLRGCSSLAALPAEISQLAGLRIKGAWWVEQAKEIHSAPCENC
jgi:hypothetical protein